MSFITVPEPQQVKIMIGMQLQGLISSIYVMQTEIEIFKAELASHDNLWLSQSTTASIAAVEELSSEDAAEFEERVTTRKAKRAKQQLESSSKVPTSLSSAPTRTRRLIHVPQELNLYVLRESGIVVFPRKVSGVCLLQSRYRDMVQVVTSS